MDMQHTLDITIGAEECDEHGFLSIRLLILHLVDAAMLRNRAEGAGKIPLRENFNAVWMIRRLKLEQFMPIPVGTELHGFGSGRTMLTSSYVVRGEYYCGDALAARMDFLVMPVEFDTRQKLELETVETLYTTKPANFVPAFERLPMYKGLDYPLRTKIKPEDCDGNKHFAAANYAELICRQLSYYDKPGNFFKVLQMDFVREITAGKTLKLSVRSKDSGYNIQGKHMNDYPCFNAYCELKEE